MTASAFATAILHWFDQHGRKDLPWQHNINAYRVWISEIMLQQTQVATVIPYYQRFMQRFPDPKRLAQAEQDEVLHHWSGLGYYSRARNLHKSAQLICEQHDGELPDSIDALMSLPGIGRSTAGAIAAIAYQKHAAILDGNVKRVLARHFGVDGWPGKQSVANTLWALAETHTPKRRVADYTQAIMDLGATCCTRSKPQCGTCPIANSCHALANDCIALLPGKKPKKARPTKQTDMFLICRADHQVLLEKRPQTGIWAGLWSLPEQLDNLPAENVTPIANWSPIQHAFSHFQLTISPIECCAKAAAVVLEPKRWLWYDLNQPAEIGLAAPVAQLLNQLSQKRLSSKPTPELT